MAFLVLSAASAVLLAALAVVLWVRRPPAPLWPVAFACQVFALLWVLGDLWASNSSTLQEKQAAFVVLFTGSLLLPAAWWETSRRYVIVHGLGRPWMHARWASLPVAVAAGTWLWMVTNPWHGQFITPAIDRPNVYGPGLLTAFYANYVIAALTVGLCLWAATRHASPDVRKRMLLLAVATSAPAIGNLVHLSLPGAPREDTTAAGLAVASATVLYGIHRQRLFNPLPVSIAQMLRRVREGLLVLDRGGRLLTWNRAASDVLRGVDLEPDMRLLRVLARHLENEEVGGRLRSSRQLTEILTGDGEPDAAHVFRLRAGGEERWIDLSVIPIPGRRGRLAAVCLHVRDVTEPHQAVREREALAEQMRDVDKLQSLGRMAGGVAHDFNNLLTAILGNTELTLEELPPGAAGRDYLQEVVEATRMAADLTEQLLAYAGRSELIAEPVSISSLVEDMGLLVGSSFARNVDLRTHLFDDMPKVMGDATQLRQVVLNLVVNAAEAIGDGEGYVTIRSERVELSRAELRKRGLQDELAPGSHALLEVSDSGCGMDEQTRRRVFEPFFSTRNRGRGLGLAAVFGIVRAHRGAISVESEPGAGSTFRVWIPVCSDDLAAFRPLASVREPARLRRGSGTVLVVDDQERVRKLAVRVLTRAGFRVLLAGNGREAVRCFRQRSDEIDVVLLDLTMPEMSGEDAFYEILAVDPEARVVLTSGFDEADAMKRLSSGKLGGFLHKPWHPAELLESIHRALEARS